MGSQASPANGKYSSTPSPQGYGPKSIEPPDAIVRGPNNQVMNTPPAPANAPSPDGLSGGGTPTSYPNPASQPFIPEPSIPQQSQGKYSPPPQPQGKYQTAPQPQKPQQPSVPISQQPQLNQQVGGQTNWSGVTPAAQNFGTSSQTKDQLPQELQQVVANGGDEADFTRLGYVKNQQNQWVKS